MGRRSGGVTLTLTLSLRERGFLLVGMFIEFLRGCLKALPFTLNLSKGSRRCSWFDKLTTNGFRRLIGHPLRQDTR